MDLRAIIVVGPDGIGKTTLCRSAVAPGQWASSGSGPSHGALTYCRPQAAENWGDTIEEHKIFYCAAEILRWTRGADTPLIYDRFPYPDEIIYSKFLGSKGGNSPDRWSHWQAIGDGMRKHAAIVMLWPKSPALFLLQARRNPDAHIRSEWLPYIMESYDTFFRSTPVCKVRVEIDTSLQQRFDAFDVWEVLFNVRRLARRYDWQTGVQS